MKFDITDRYTGSVIYTAEIEAFSFTTHGVKMGLAVKAALEAGADLINANLNDANLIDAYLPGVVFRNAILRQACFRGADMRGADMREASVIYANLIDANLIDADLRGADLTGTRLTGAVLPDADRIPKITCIHGKVYDAAKAEGALNMMWWHDDDGWCGTTHCRAGWVCVLAGEEGRAFERKYGTCAAAALIYQASDPGLERIPDFYASNEAALADMKRLAEMEAAQ